MAVASRTFTREAIEKIAKAQKKEHLSELKAKIARSLKHWVLPMPSMIAFYGERIGGKASEEGDRILIPAWAQGFVTYQIAWLQYAPELPAKQREAAECILIGQWTLKETAKTLEVSQQTVERYVGWALDGVAARIISHREKLDRCPRCGGTLLIDSQIRDTVGNVLSVEVTCALGCQRSIADIARELINKNEEKGEN